MSIQIGDTFIIGIGTYDVDTGKNSEYAKAEVVELNARGDKDYYKLEVIGYSCPRQICHKVYLTNKV